LAEATHLLGLPLKHKPKDIKPQGAGSGLDADKVDGLHANELGGGGPHAGSHETGGGDKVHFADLERDEGDATLHDAFTGVPHVSQAEKDKIHDRLHALDSSLDHSGAINDAQHGTRGINLHSDAHSVYAIISCRVGLVGGNATSYTLVNNSDMLLNISDFPANAKGRLRVNWKNTSGSPQTLYLRLYDQYGGVEVSGSEVSQALNAGASGIAQSSQFMFPMELKSFMAQYKIAPGGTMDIFKIELQIERS